MITPLDQRRLATERRATTQSGGARAPGYPKLPQSRDSSTVSSDAFVSLEAISSPRASLQARLISRGVLVVAPATGQAPTAAASPTGIGRR
jgi:hypothetical protein